MTPMQQVRAELTAQLHRQNFDFAWAEPILAWQAFKSFVEIPVPYKTVGIGVEILHVNDRDDIQYLEYIRRLQDEHGAEIDFGCLLSREVPSDMVAMDKAFWRYEQSESLNDYFANVEASPEFKKCIILGDWEWEQ